MKVDTAAILSFIKHCLSKNKMDGLNAREGVIIKWPLSGLLHDRRDLIIIKST